jgi:hypothetical protein
VQQPGRAGRTRLLAGNGSVNEARADRPRLCAIGHCSIPAPFVPSEPEGVHTMGRMFLVAAIGARLRP